MAIVGDLAPIYRGEDVVLTLTVPEDITGWDVRLYVVDPVTAQEVHVSDAATLVDAENGVCTVALAAAVTLALPPRLYWYELRRVNVGSRAVLRTGNVQIEDSPSSIGDTAP